MVGDIPIQHYGTLGMKWGVRKKSSRTPSEDAARARTFQKQAKKQGSSTLSNKDLQLLVTRMNLEQQYSRLSHPNKEGKVKKGLKFVKDIIGVGTTVNDAVRLIDSPVGNMLKDNLQKIRR